MRSLTALASALLLLLVPACAPEVEPVAAPATTANTAPDTAPDTAPAAAPSAPAVVQVGSAAESAVLPEARALVERFLALTKYDVVARSQSRHERGTLTLSIGKGTVETFRSRPDASRQVMSLGDYGAFESGVTQGRAWITLPGGVATLLEGVELLQARVEGAYDEATKPAARYESMTTLGREVFEGVDCWKVELVLRPAPGMDAEATRRARTSLEYYEVASGLLRAQTGMMEGEISQGPYTRIFEDYRELAGTVVATRMVLRQDPLEVVTTLEALEFDRVSEAQLTPPRAIQRLIAAEGEEELGR